MSERKFTDEEIKKALECCMKMCADCDNCPRINNACVTVPDCKEELCMDVLDLINRQQAEIDGLKKDDLPRCIDALRIANEIGMALEKENQKLKAEIDNYSHNTKMMSDSLYKTQKLVESKQADIERLQKLLDNEENKYMICAKKFYKNGIKEFAERLRTHWRFCGGVIPYDEIHETIDNLVKEMVGEAE